MVKETMRGGGNKDPILSATEVDQPPTETLAEQGQVKPTPRPLVLVFGPGLAQSFAYIGVFKALESAKVPIRAVVATEVGALVAALYSTSKTANEFEWKLGKFKEQHFYEPDSTIKKWLKFSNSSEKRFSELLQQVFLNRELRDSSNRIEVSIAVWSEAQQSVVLVREGLWTGVIKAAMGGTPTLKSGLLGAGAAYSSALREPFPIELAKKQYPDCAIVVISLEGQNTEQAHSDELDWNSRYSAALEKGKSSLVNADFVLRIENKNVGFLEFGKKATAAFNGKRAMDDGRVQVSAALNKQQTEEHEN